MDEKLKWLETRISSSLRPRNEDLKHLFSNDENRLSFHEFINNEDVRRLFVFVRPPRQLIASLQPPHDLRAKSIFFLKNNVGVKLTRENMDEEVMYMDCGDNALTQLDMLTRELYLPLLCSDTGHASHHGVSADKLMDLLHRLMAHLETIQGHAEGEIILPLPSIEVLAEAAENAQRRGAVLHVLETTVIGWIKQIKGLLKHDPLVDMERQSGEFPGPLDEVRLWRTRLSKLQSINQQLDSPVAQDILRNLDEASSTYAHSFHTVRRHINQAIEETEENLKFLQTMLPWFEHLHECLDPQELLKLFPPLIHTLLLVWQNSKYYHQADKFHSLLRLISNEVVHRAEAMVGEDVLREPLESYSKLKEALRVCAAFRGTYLDYRDKAEVINDKNKKEHAEKMHHRPQGFQLFSTKMYGSQAYTPRYGTKEGEGDDYDNTDEELTKDSMWPPRNAPAFDLLNAFMERCNDVLELVQTTRHFRLLSDAAEVGGAGSQSLDALVKEIHSKYSQAMHTFFSKVSNVLAIDGTQAFERAFFTFRTVVKDLEKKISEVLRQAFAQCPTIGAQLRLLEVFEGISGRELVQVHLKDKDNQLVRSFTDELVTVRHMFQMHHKKPPLHANMPLVVSKLMWVWALKQRINGPMLKMKKVSPHSLEGDLGWQLRDAYAEAMSDLDRFESRVVNDWQLNVTAELTDRLKQPLLMAEDYDEDEDIRPQTVHVNLDPALLQLLREIHYLAREPFCLKLPGPARELLRNTNSQELRVLATRLETIVSKYNTVMKSLSEYEQPLFERNLAKIDQLFEQGLNTYTWRTHESADFIETANALVCTDLHTNLDIVQTNCKDIANIAGSWSQGTLDVFAARQPETSYTIEQLTTEQSKLNDDVEMSVGPSGNKIHALLGSSFEAVQMSEASPAWQDYLDYIDAIVLDGLKKASLVSLKSMLNQIVTSNMGEDGTVPILTIRLELLENQVAFRPPLDQSTSDVSVNETVATWLDAFLSRGSLVPMLGGKGSYQDYIQLDEEVQQLVEHINKLVRDNANDCTTLYEMFRDYAFLWEHDVNQTFADFLKGKVSPNPLRNSSKVISSAQQQRMLATANSASSHDEKTTSTNEESAELSSRSSTHSDVVPAAVERTFLTPRNENADENANVPSLDEFDAEIAIYRSARDDVEKLSDHEDVGWLRVDLRPIKQVLITYASKWMWTFTKYLSDQVTHMLENLDAFLKRIEPEIESITGEERDTASFMKMMRLFNQVSAQQQEMDGKFSAMQKTVVLVKRYGHKLPEHTQRLFDAAPSRWNNLKTKVSLAKQRLGPRIQEESDSITRDLAKFGERVVAMHEDLEKSEVYQRDCSLADSWVLLDQLGRRLEILESEAHDLIELQDLLEANVVDFSLLPQCRHDLENLRQVWETVRVIEQQQSEWKRHRWQKMNTRFLRDETNKQLETVGALPEDVFTWDVYMGLFGSIKNIQDCLPLIDDLSNPAMRTRHWKQLVRVTGGAIQIDNETLKKMTLGELLSLGLQKHVDDVRAIVQRAVKDLSIEQSLKNYEAVWLGKVFTLREHVRNKNIAYQQKQDKEAGTGAPDQADSQSEMGSHQGSSEQQGGKRTGTRLSNHSSLSRGRRTSISSLPQSLLNLGEDNGHLMLLTNTKPIFEELESHQVSLGVMQSSSAAGSFLDEVTKWQRRLQNIEGVLTTWLSVQDKWVELEEIYSTQDLRTALAHDANKFAAANRDFRLLMRATEKNANVLQSCSRKHIMAILERMNYHMEQCRKSLLTHLERRRQLFPRFYFLSMQDVMHIVCNSYDLNQVNLYINKLLVNVGALVHAEIEEGEKSVFQITAVKSALGETLPLKEVVRCEGQVESWLAALLSALKESLKYQVATASGLEKPPTRMREIHSAGARRIQVPDRRPAANNSRPTTRERVSSRSGSRSKMKTPTEKAPEMTREPAGHSGVLDHVTEVVYLVKRVELTRRTEEALTQLDSGNKDSIQATHDALVAALQATVLMLKGLEDEKETRARRTHETAKSESEARSVKESERHSDAQSQSNAAKSHRGSQRDLSKDPSATQPPPIAEEGEEGSRHGNDEDAASQMEPATSEPVDTMDLGAVAVVVPTTQKQEEDEQSQHGSAVDESELKLMLMPGQTLKLQVLIGLLVHQRDVLRRLQEEYPQANTPVSQSFTWRSQLHYSLDDQTRNVSVQCMEHVFDYGFEYQGSAMRDVSTPLTERVFLSFSQAIKSFSSSLAMGPAGNGQLAVVSEFARCLGRPLYTFNCTSVLDSTTFYDILKGFAMTGSWICLNQVTQVRQAVLSSLAQLLGAVLDALRAQKQSVLISGDEVPLSPDGACFSVIDTAIKVTAQDPEKLLIFPAASSQLPAELLAHFRVVNMVTPDYQLMVEALLISQGFLRATDLAHKTVLLFNMCKQLIGTNTALCDDVSSMAYNSLEVSHGWSRQTLRFVTAEAGHILDQLVGHRLALQEELEEDMETIPEEDHEQPAEPVTEQDAEESAAPNEEKTEDKPEEDKEKDGEEQGGEQAGDGREKHESEQPEKGAATTSRVQLDLSAEEDEALVTALRNTFLPRLVDRDASLFATLVRDLWPTNTVPLHFGGHDEPRADEAEDSRPATREEIALRRPTSREEYFVGSRPGTRDGSRPATRELMYGAPGGGLSSRPITRDPPKSTAKSKKPSKNFRDFLLLNTPVVLPPSSMDHKSSQMTRLNVEDVDDAIAIATGKLGLLPGVTFQARVSQLAQLNVAHRTVVVAGPAGCGKSECIKTFALAERERGKTIDVQTIFTKSVESRELLGYLNPITKEWREGLLPALLRRFCLQHATENYNFNINPVMKIMQLDGEMDAAQLELMQTILHTDGAVVLANNERIVVPDTLRFIWETESLACLSPALLANVGVLVMTKEDVGWRMMLAMWVDRRSDSDRALMRSLTECYVESIVQYLAEAIKLPMYGGAPDNTRFRRVVWQSVENMVMTFTNLLEALINPYPDLSDPEIENYFVFASLWAFCGTLEAEYREPFSMWWRKEFRHTETFPSSGSIFDYVVDNESFMFVKWVDQVPQYSGTPHTGIPSESFVNTVNTQQLLYVLGLLSDMGRPVMLVGEHGCGKSSILSERVRTVCSGEVAEVLSLALQANRFSNGRLLYERLDEKLEWKHGRTYIPKGNKKLLCFIDDINLAQVDAWHNQTAVELIRQHVDDGGFYDPDEHSWRYVKNVNYVTSINPHTTASVPRLNTRLLRHFALFNCPYPSCSEQETIFSTLLGVHFIAPELSVSTSVAPSHGNKLAADLGIEDKKEKIKMAVELKEEEEAMRALLALLVDVTVELQAKLRTMFLATAQRCHYMFTMRDLGIIFRNLCLSTRPGCSRDQLLLLWEHECHWVYGHRMVNDVDHDRYRQSFSRAVRKKFSNEDHIALLSKTQKPIFSNLVEQDSGYVTAGSMLQNTANSKLSEEDLKTDLYKPEYNAQHVRTLLDHAMEEYNKSQPRIQLAMYRSVLEQVCRLARVLASPHEVAHCILVAEGCPGRCTIMASLAAHLCGFSIFKINPSPISVAQEYKLDTFKADLVSAYTRAGVKGEKMVFLVEEEEIVDEDFLVYLSEFIVSGTISHLFTYEEQTTIINSIRTEVTQAGLVYTREVAWNFFLKIVKKNLRICLIVSDVGARFQRRCREYPSFAKSVNFLWFPHWSKRQLIKQAAFHIKDIGWMERKTKENLSHMLATMHMVIRQQDGQEQTAGQYNHLTNLTYEKFVERFVHLANDKHLDMSSTHDSMLTMMDQIQIENAMATRLKKELEHEKVVLTERKSGTVRILSQIGQDTAITEQQIRIVKSQMEKIHVLKKLLPEYQVSHERAVYKTVAIVADTKKIVQNMHMDSLAELRAMNRPIIEVEDLLAAIIMILKNPQADLTWQKGAKRQMANLERFIEELMTFDEAIMPEATLVLVEPYLKKPSFDPVSLEKKTHNSACASLCKWVSGVCRYHRMMISKVKPLHMKVEQTTQAIDDAEHKMSILENKRRALEVRLSDLAKGFEEATIDKNDQEKKTIKMDKLLETAGRLRKVLRKERARIQQVIDSLPLRQASIGGGVAIASAFASYLGPYHYSFRRLMLTVHWPNCLRERGVPLVIDSIDELKGRVVDWQIAGLRTISAEGQDRVLVEGVRHDDDEGDSDNDENDVEPELAALSKQDDEKEKEGEEAGEEKTGEEGDNEVLEGAEDQPQGTPTSKKASTPGTKPTTPGAKPGSPAAEQAEKADEEKSEKGSQKGSAKGLEGISEKEEGSRPPTNRGETALRDSAMGGESVHTGATMPVITSEQYNQYVRSLIKLMVGETTTFDWVKRDFGARQLENAAIVVSSWQRPPMLLDPYEEGLSYVQWLSKAVHRKRPVTLDMDTRSDPNVILAIEKCIMRGRPVLLENCEEYIDSMVTPIIQHRNTAMEDEHLEEPRLIKHAGRKILCHPTFRLYLHTKLPKPRFSPTVASTTTLVNYGSSNETLVDDLLMRAFARIRPELYKERRIALKAVFTNYVGLTQVKQYFRDKLKSNLKDKKQMFDERDVDIISDITGKSIQMTNKLSETKEVVKQLEGLKEELFPLARRATTLYALLQSMACVEREYQFTLPYFYKLFDEAVGGEFPPEYYEETDDPELDESEAMTEDSEKQRAPAPEAQQPKATENTGKEEIAAPAGLPETIQEEDETSQAERKSLAADSKKEEDETSQAERKSLAADSKKEAESTTDGTEKTAEDKVPVFEMPEAPTLPSEGVEYNSIPDQDVNALVERLTALVYQRCHGSLYQEHRLLFATLLCLNIQEETSAFTEEELSLLLQGNPGLGMQLSLADFDCEEEAPSWLPSDKWDDIMAVSVLPGPLDSLCVRMAKEGEPWQAWYTHAEPETQPLPIANNPGDKKEEEGEDAKSEAADSLSEFHRLLLLRLLRPDRLALAMSSYVAQQLSEPLGSSQPLSLDQLLEALHYGMGGVLVLLPRGDAGSSPAQRLASLSMTMPPSQVIAKLAELKNVTLDVVTVGQGNDMEILSALESAEREDTWVLVQDAHLMHDKMMRELKYILQRVAKHRDPEKSEKFCIWLTSEPCERFPLDMLQYIFKCAWDRLETLVSSSVSGEEPSELDFESGSLQHVLIQAVTATFEAVSNATWESVEGAGVPRTVLYGVGVVHGVLRARQMYGAMAGLSQCYPLMSSVYTSALETVASFMQGAPETPSHEVISQLLATGVYGGMMSNIWDLEYTEAVIKHILREVMTCQGDTFPLGATTFPMPPSNTVKRAPDMMRSGSIGDHTVVINIKAREFAAFLDKQTVDTIPALSLQPCVDKQANDAMAAEFMTLLDRLYEAQNMDLGDIQVLRTRDIDVIKLRAILDNVIEQLPPLLELGTVPSDVLAVSEFDFPYHRPSVLSLVTAESTLMPESLGFVLLQECLWLNAMLCHVRQNLFDLHTRLIGGEGALPWQLKDVVHSLAEEQVPASWVHPNCQPSTHSLGSWQTDLTRRHSQMKTWIKQRMIPIFESGNGMREEPVSHGSLSSVWLGGLVNPGALFTALRHEKAVLSKCFIDQVTLECSVSQSLDEDDYEGACEEGGIYVRDLYLQGAAWDTKTNALSSTTRNLSRMPSVYVRPVLESELVANNDHPTRFNCPVFMNKARQVAPFSLPLSTREDDVQQWIMSSSAIILDPGLPADAAKKSRAYQVVKAPATYRSDAALDDEHYEQFDEDEEEQELQAANAKSQGDRSSPTSQGHISHHTQQSYKPISPKADPLPADLQIKRESPMIKEAGRKTPKSDTERSESKSVRIKSGAADAKSETEQSEGVGNTTDNETERSTQRGDKSAMESTTAAETTEAETEDETEATDTQVGDSRQTTERSVPPSAKSKKSITSKTSKTSNKK